MKPSDVIPDGAERPNTLHALLHKRAETAGKIEHLQRELRRTVGELDHLDATIRIFEPGIDLAELPNKPVPARHCAFKGEVTRVILACLRKANGPCTTPELARELMIARGLDPEDLEFRPVMVKRAGACLRNLKNKGLVRTLPSVGQLSRWEAVRKASDG